MWPEAAARQKPSRAPAVQWQLQHLEAPGTTLERHEYIQPLQKPHTHNQHINVFHSSPKSLGRLGEPALHTHHLQGPAIYCRLRPVVRSSGPHRPVWHEYVTHVAFIPGCDTLLTQL